MEDFDVGDFVYDFPLWFLGNRKAMAPAKPLSGVLRGTSQDCGDYPLLFTDDDLAMRYQQADARLGKYRPIQIEDDVKFKAFLDATEQKGCKYVGIDAIPGRGRKVRMVSLVAARASIK